MGDVFRSGPKSMVGHEFYDIEEIGALSFCPDSNDGSTPATQVHVHITLRKWDGGANPPFVMRCHKPGTLDKFIESLIEHRTYVFGKRDYHSNYKEQK